MSMSAEEYESKLETLSDATLRLTSHIMSMSREKIIKMIDIIETEDSEENIVRLLKELKDQK